MIPDLLFWVRLLGVLTVELALAAAALALFARWVRAPQIRRSLWQAGLVALALIVTVECAGLRAFVALLGPVSYRPPERRLVASVREPIVSEPAATFAVLPSETQIPAVPTLRPALSVVWWPGYMWLLGTVLFGLRALTLRVWLARERRRAGFGDVETQASITHLQGALGLHRVQLRVWSRLRGQIAFGTLWPTIAVPADFAVRFTPAQREAMLAHELAHLAGRDPLWLAVADAVCALAWWHPGVWWVRRQLRAASEEAADEASTLVPEGVTALAESLVTFGRELATPGPARSLGVAGSGFRSELGRRVAALLGSQPAWRPLGLLKRWQMRFAVVVGVAALAALPWPGAGGPSMLALIVYETHAQVEVPPAREDVAATTDRGTDVKHYYGRNRMDLAHVSPTLLISPSGPTNVPGPSLEDGSFLDSNRPAPPSLSLTIPFPFGKVVGYQMGNQPNEIERQKPTVSFPEPLSTAVPEGIWDSPQGGTARSRYVFLREPGFNTEPIAGPTSAIDPLTGQPRVEGGNDSVSAGADVTVPLYTRTYRLPDPVKFLAAIRRTEGVTQTTNIQLNLRQFFGLCGFFSPPFAKPPPEGDPNANQKALFFNDRTGIFFFRATMDDQKGMERVLAAMSSDWPRGPAVTLEVQFAEITARNADDIGLDWLFGLSPTNNPALETTPLKPKSGGRVETLRSEGEVATLNTAQFGALQQRLKQRSGVDFLSAPKVTTTAGRPAQITVADMKTIVTGVNAMVDATATASGFDDVTVSPTNQQAGINYQVETMSFGPKLDVMPWAEGDGWRLDLVATVTEFLGYDDPGKENEPFVQNQNGSPLKATKPRPRLRVREMQAKVLARSGETVALRGAMAEVRTVTPRRLFRRGSTNVVTKRLYAFVTPVAGEDTSAAITTAVQPLIITVTGSSPYFQFGQGNVAEADLTDALKAKAKSAGASQLVLLIRTEPKAPESKVASLRARALDLGLANMLLNEAAPPPR